MTARERSERSAIANLRKMEPVRRSVILQQIDSTGVMAEQFFAK